MARGRIVSIRREGSFGVICPDEGMDAIFFHGSTVIAVPFDELRAGQRVAVDVGSDPSSSSRTRAENVRLSEPSARPELTGPGGRGARPQRA